MPKPMRNVQKASAAAQGAVSLKRPPERLDQPMKAPTTAGRGFKSALPKIISTLGYLSRVKPVQAKWMSREEAIMGTAIRAELWHEDPAKGEAALDAVMEEMHRIDRAMSPWLCHRPLYLSDQQSVTAMGEVARRSRPVKIE